MIEGRVEADYRGHRIVTEASSHHSNVGGAAERAREAYHGGALGEGEEELKAWRSSSPYYSSLRSSSRGDDDPCRPWSRLRIRSPSAESSKPK